MVDIAPVAGAHVNITDFVPALMNVEFDKSLSLSQTRRNVANQILDVIKVSADVNKLQKWFGMYLVKYIGLLY